MQKFRMHLLSPAMLGMTRGYLYRFSVKLISDFMYSINPHILLKQIWKQTWFLNENHGTAVCICLLRQKRTGKWNFSVLGLVMIIIDFWVIILYCCSLAINQCMREHSIPSWLLFLNPSCPWKFCPVLYTGNAQKVQDKQLQKAVVSYVRIDDLKLIWNRRCT